MTSVAQFCYEYLPKSQTFMHFSMSSMRRVRPIVISLEPLVNTELFPLPNGALHEVKGARKTTRWVRDGILRKTLGLGFMDRMYERRMRRIAEAEGCAVAHAHFGTTGFLVLPIAKSLRMPLVTNFYGSDTAPVTHDPVWPEQRRTLFREGDLFLVEGAHMRQRLIDLGCPPEKVEVQRIAIRFDKLPKRDTAPRHPQPVILFAGRFVEKKGLIYAIDAVNRLVRSGYKLEFRIIGDGPTGDECRAFVKENSLESVVRFLGFLNHDQYLAELQRANVFLHPSVTAANGDTEGGAPTTILEAQACGVPVVATTHADIPNVVSAGESAVLAPERDAEQLAACLTEVIDHPDRWDLMGRAGRRFVEQYHDVSREVTLLEDKYMTLIGRQQPI
jgi:colanic acid/amylovoran biosynthesis glycosyltransferase